MCMSTSDFNWESLTTLACHGFLSGTSHIRLPVYWKETVCCGCIPGHRRSTKADPLIVFAWRFWPFLSLCWINLFQTSYSRSVLSWFFFSIKAVMRKKIVRSIGHRQSLPPQDQPSLHAERYQTPGQNHSDEGSHQSVNWFPNSTLYIFFFSVKHVDFHQQNYNSFGLCFWGTIRLWRP